MRRRWGIAAALIVALVPASAWADKPPAPPVAENGGYVAGRVTSIDYQQGALTVATARGSVDVMTMPTTSVQSADPGYHTITDVQKGSTVQIYTARVGGKLVAQIIRLVKR